MVSGFSLAGFAVFYGVCGAAADAGHAVSAVAVPSRAAVFQADIARGTDAPALAAGHAPVRDGKAPVAYHKAAECGVDHTGLERVCRRAARFCQVAPINYVN